MVGNPPYPPFNKGGHSGWPAKDRGELPAYSCPAYPCFVIYRYESHLKPYARALRKNMTLAEKRLWYRLNRQQLRGARFYRQRSIGPYIVDFFCPKARLVIEVDGGQHFCEEGRFHDEERDGYLSGLGLKVLRFSDRDVLTRTDEVVQAIWKEMP